MPKTLSLTKDQATAMMLRWQGLLDAPRFFGQAGALDFVRQAGCVQFDPLDPCGRNAEQVLHSRVPDFTKEDLASLLYEQFALLDHWDKNMSLVPVEDYPKLARRRAAIVGALRQHEAVEQAKPAVLRAIAERGPLNASGLNLREKVDWWWAPTHVGRATLETLYQSGALVVTHRKGTTRTFDLACRHLPRTLLRRGDGFEDDGAYYAWCVHRRIRAVGLLWDKRSDAWLSIEGLTPALRAAAFERLQKGRKIVPVRVEGFSQSLYAPREALAFLEGEHPAPRTELIAPLDSLIWDRKLIEALFGFTYRWEVYTPKEKRQWGYYVLPVLQNGRFVGRVEVQRHKPSRGLRVIGAWWEAPLDPAAFGQCMDRLCDFDGAEGWEAEAGVCLN